MRLKRGRGRVTALAASAWRRVPWRNIAPILGLPVAFVALTGPGRPTEAIRIMRLLAVCCGIAGAASFEDPAGALTVSTPLPHFRRTGAVLVHVLAACAVAWIGAVCLATLRGHELPLMDLTVTAGLAAIVGCALGVTVVSHRPGDVSAWWAVSAFVMGTAVVAVLWRPLASMDPDSTQWARAHLWLRRALIPAGISLLLALVWPDLRRRPVRARLS